MRTIIILYLMFLSTTFYSQEYEGLKKSDTIYLLYKGKKLENKGVSPDHEERSYHFYGFEQSLTFFHFKYHSYENKVANIVSDVKVVNKSFLKKNKAKIITPRFLKKNDFCKIVNEIISPNNRTIYIIDCTEEKDDKIVLYEVLMSTICRGDG